ncbi:hypothetical protein HDZ31DRAFT_41737, partial [Schizophyllum fasciatum]
LYERVSSLASRDLLRTGPFPYLPSETAPLRAVEFDLQAGVQRLNTELKRLIDLRKEALDRLAIVRSMLAPIRRLPAELLSEIFAVAGGLCKPTLRMKAARTLAEICTIWRATARGTPSLWTCVDYTRGRPERLEELLRMHADLTEPLPLELCAAYKNARYADHLLTFAPQYTSRFGELTLHGDSRTFDVDITPDFTSLVRAHVAFSGNSHRAAYKLHFLAKAHALRSLIVDMSPSSFQHHIEGPVLPFLTDLTLNNRSEAYSVHFLPFLRRCAATVRRLTLINTSLVVTDNQHIAFPVLDSLDFHHSAHEYLTMLHAPAVTSVALRNWRGLFDGAITSLLRFLRTSHPRIHTLKLNSVSAPPSDDFLCCLEYLPSLEKLHITRAPWDAVPWNALIRMACTDFREPLVSRLTVFTLRYADGQVPEKLQRALRVMLRSRAARKTLWGCTVEALQRVETDLQGGDGAGGQDNSATR